MVILGVVPVLAAPLLLLAALAVRFGGPRPVLNSVDSARISDPAGLHRFAGNRMLVLPVLAAGFGLAAFERPMLGGIGAAALVAAIVVVLIRIAAGIDRFNASGSRDTT